MVRAAQPCVMIQTPVASEPSDMMGAPLGKNWRLWRTLGHTELLNTSQSRAAKGGKSLSSVIGGAYADEVL
jgi:hypothetical protein